MNPRVAFAFVLLVAIVGILYLGNPSLTGMFHSPWEVYRKPLLNAQAPAAPILQKPLPVYQGMFYRCQEQANLDMKHCFQRYYKEIESCEDWACAADQHLSSCLYYVRSTWQLCYRFRNKVSHDLGNLSPLQ